MSRPRAVAVGAGLLALILALTLFLPRGSDDDRDALLPSVDDDLAGQLRPANEVGASRITPAMRAEIDRVVGAGRAAGRVSTKAGLAAAAAAGVRCADLDGQRYCLGIGWTDDSEQEVRARVLSSARVAARSERRTNTGDLDAAALLARTAQMAPAARAKRERAELEDAARAVTKVWLLRHEIQGVPLPDDFLARHPEARLTGASGAARTATTTATSAAAARSKTLRDYPQKSSIMRQNRVSEQARTYWCGPTSMQMITWGWSGTKRSQAYWARQLGTTTSGTGITDMVRVVNRDTGWDRKSRAGTYITLDIGDWSYRQWLLLMMRHIHDYRAPVVLHPALLKRYYPYLDDDASGHFQVGRGYDKNGTRLTKLSYFEPWNQQRFDPSEPYIARVQWRAAYKSYRANQAHFLHNVGV